MILNGTTYHKETPLEVINALDLARENKFTIRFWYGKDGVSWDEENDTIGKIGRSTGTSKIPLLIKNSRSFGGGAVLDHCIVKIVDIKNKRTLYQHPNFKQGFYCADDVLVYKGMPFENEEIYATCKTCEQAVRIAKFMNGERNAR